MTLNDVIERDLQRCRDARRKDWHCNFDGLNTTRRESVWQSAWEVLGGILFLALLAGLCWWISR